MHFRIRMFRNADAGTNSGGGAPAAPAAPEGAAPAAPAPLYTREQVQDEAMRIARGFMSTLHTSLEKPENAPLLEKLIQLPVVRQRLGVDADPAQGQPAAKPDAAAAEEIRKRVLAELAPKLSEAEEATKQASSMRAHVVRSTTESAASQAGFKTESPVVAAGLRAMTEHRLAFVSTKDSSGRVIEGVLEVYPDGSPVPNGKGGYRTASDLFAELAADPANAPYLRPTSQNVPGVNGARGGVQTVSRSAFFDNLEGIVTGKTRVG